MACCILAAFLFAQAMAVLRRWGMFWGLVPVPAGETVDTAFTRATAWLARPTVRRAGVALAAVELVAVSGWLYAEHRQHIIEVVDVTWSRWQGEQIVYAGVCSKGDARVRVVLGPTTSALGS